ncbi:MAG: hypothetical protein A2762_03760 [Candidatus Lloydbacteria bacterium RIFCSPHIGHO2_01_FULL_54_11]|nr:MAG: hypothetical protein A2762_03760 [Candidatus Lloydbacteria bacterium RIFCSPHIGHO2_01_FULL_54_11]
MIAPFPPKKVGTSGAPGRSTGDPSDIALAVCTNGSGADFAHTRPLASATAAYTSCVPSGSSRSRVYVQAP